MKLNELAEIDAICNLNILTKLQGKAGLLKKKKMKI